MKARRAFGKRYEPWYPKAVKVLEDDWDRMVAFYDFPEAHWKHLRTTNVVESPFASVRLRTSAAKRFKRVESAIALIWKLLTVAEKALQEAQRSQPAQRRVRRKEVRRRKARLNSSAQGIRLRRLHTY